MNQVSGSTNLGDSSGLSLEGGWGRFIEMGALELSLWITLLAVFTVAAIWKIKKIRAKAVQQEPEASQLLSKFREQRSRGELSEEEFREIKATLAVQLKEELKDSDEMG